MKLSHSTISLNGVWLSPPAPSSVAFFISTGLSSIISTRTRSATLLFIHFCEAFLGIEPQWDIFGYLFRVKPQPTSKNPSVVGAPASSLGNRPVTNIFPTNSPPTSLDEKTIGSASETMPPNSLKDQVSPLFCSRSGTPSSPRGTWTKSMSC
jgi:hypothetical protein